MKYLDLRHHRCPLALVLTKQALRDIGHNDPIKVLFAHQEAMNDICLYLDKKKYVYSREGNSLIISNDYLNH